MQANAQEVCPGLEELRASNLRQISNDVSIFNVLEFWPEKLNADEMAYCLIEYGWVLGDIIYPETLNDSDQILRLNVIDYLVTKKVSLHKEFSIKVNSFFGGSFTKPEVLKLTLYVGLLSIIDSYWHSKFNSDWSWDEKVQNSF